MHRSGLLTVFALTLGVVGSACSRSRIESRLVGTWRPALDVDMARTLAKVLQDSGSTESPEAVGKRLQEQPAADSEEMCGNTFAADGTFVMEGTILGHLIHEVHRWRPVSETNDRVTIEIEDLRENHRGEKEQHTFVFEQPDLIREEGGLLGGQHSRRVK